MRLTYRWVASHVNYSNPGRFGFENDSISSIQVGLDVHAILCRDTDFEGDCQLFPGGRQDSNLAGTIGDDTVSSIKVQPLGFEECVPGSQEVSLFKHSDFLAPCVIKPVGDYASAAAIGLDDNSISSIRVGSSVQACVCSAKNFRELCNSFTHDAFDLADYDIGTDQISSVKVQVEGAECRPSTTPTQGQGFSEISAFNCDPQRHAVHLWTRDITAGEEYVERGTLDPQYSGNSCPAGAEPFHIELKDGHTYAFVAIDPSLTGCNGQNNPEAESCKRFTFDQTILGSTSGPSLTAMIS